MRAKRNCCTVGHCDFLRGSELWWSFGSILIWAAVQIWWGCRSPPEHSLYFWLSCLCDLCLFSGSCFLFFYLAHDHLHGQFSEDHWKPISTHFIITPLSSVTPFFCDISFSKASLISSLCPYSPFLLVFLGGLVCDLLYAPCHGSFHVFDFLQDSCHNHLLGGCSVTQSCPTLCNLMDCSMPGSLSFINSWHSPWPTLCLKPMLLHDPVHFLGHGTFQSPILSQGPDQCQFCGHGGCKCLFFYQGNRNVLLGASLVAGKESTCQRDTGSITDPRRSHILRRV